MCKRVLLWVLLCFPAAAQFDSGTVLGTIKDRTDAVVPGVQVTLTNLDTGITATRTTEDAGLYEFVNVRPGRYKLVAEKTGFAMATAESFMVSVGARQRVDLTLSVGQVAESVEVTATVPIVESESSERGQVIEAKKIVELPLNGRNYADLALLSTGVRRSNYAVANPPREAAFNVNGQRSTFNNFLLDGVDNNAYGTSNQGFSNQVVNLPPDAIQEFRIVTNNMSAEYGRASGAMINASMRSGTNEFHGALWEFLRNDKLNATGFFPPPGGQKPTLKRNQFGFVFGGPIMRDRLFFFTDYEGFRERTGQIVSPNVPTAAQRQGIFPVEVRNPLTGRTYPANTPIPRDDMTPLARFMLDNLPFPNSTNPATPNQFINWRNDRNNTDKMDAKIDGQIASKLTAFVRASHRKMNLFQAPDIPTIGGGGGNGFVRALNQQLAFGATWTASSTTLVEARMGFSKTRAGKEPPFIGGPSMRSLFGITGLSEDPRLTGGITAQDLQGGLTQLGRQATNPQWQHPFLYNPRLVASHVAGRQSIKAGYEYQQIHTEIQDVNPLYGRDFYQGAFTRIVPAGVTPPALNTAGQQAYSLADFMFGLRSRYALTNFFIADYRQAGHMFYVQDDVRVTSKLTLNLGVRYEYFTPQWEKNNLLSNFDPATRTLETARDGGVYERALVHPDRNNWAPRIGLAYAMTPRTAIRSGYGVSYIHFNRSGGGNILAINGPQVVNALVNQNPSQASFRPTQAGYPAGLTDPDKFNAATANISYMPRDTRTGYVQNWFLSIQREILPNTVFDIAYVGNRSNKLILFADFNEARPNGAGENLALAARRPIQGFGGITITCPCGWANYHALQMKVERRYAAGISLLNSFTWSKAIDTVGQALEDQGNGNRSSPQSYYNLQAEKGPSGYDQRINNTSAVVWDVPIGRGRRAGSDMNAVADALVGGWQLSGINTVTTGEPLNVRWQPGTQFQVSDITDDWRGASSPRPNYAGGNPYAESADKTVWLNRTAFAVPSDPSRPFGNLGRNALRGPGFWQLDVNLQKSFRIAERSSLQFRSEFFNLLNKTNFRSVGSTVNLSASNFGRFAQTYQPRQIQFALKLLF